MLKHLEQLCRKHINALEESQGGDATTPPWVVILLMDVCAAGGIYGSVKEMKFN